MNGQKVWSTSAHHAAFGMLLARTDWDAPKHKGISWMALPMRQQGVEVRPLRQMNGHASFNEVFLSDAVVPVENVVGQLGGGWPIALTTLAHERGFRSVRRRDFGSGGRALEEAKAEAEAFFATYSWYPQRAGRATSWPSTPGRQVAGMTRSADRQSLGSPHSTTPINGRPRGLGRTASSVARRDRKAPSASLV